MGKKKKDAWKQRQTKVEAEIYKDKRKIERHRDTETQRNDTLRIQGHMETRTV